MDIAAVNVLSYEDFVDVFGNVVEKCPLIPAAVWSCRPFVSVKALEAAINEFIDALPESGKTKKCFVHVYIYYRYIFSCGSQTKFCAQLHRLSWVLK